MLDTESRHGTGLVQGPTRDPWLTMDYYLGTDSLSLQEMLDVDIKCEIEGVIGGHTELGFNFTDMSSLEMDDDPIGCQGDISGWFGSTSLINGNSNSSNSNFNLDLSGSDAASIMVNPNSVMPHIAIRSPSPSNGRRHFSFSTRKEIKEEKIDVEDELENDAGSYIENENEHENDNENELENEIGNDTETEQYENDITETEEDSEDEQEIPKAVTPSKLKTVPVSTLKASPQFLKTQTTTKINGMPGIRVRNFKLLQNPNQTPQHVRKQIYNNNVHISPGAAAMASMKREKEFDLSDYDDKSYPKPAYSYSCLIAMALKNSQTGSLPVSEIYNFMCEHFPYFKTAPNGWKNSVRHNLSLNKCFEKIEKPAGNGNQRKGCLWAINPAKVAKMDEEVQKWSRKDPLAIKKAMIYPDHLELLERGEMKYAGSGDVSEETESSGDEAVEESTAFDESIRGHLAANSVTDSYDESSQDCDVDITEQLYDEIDIEENKEALHMQLNISKQESFEYELSPSTKRQKTLTGTIQGNYLYQPVTTSRRKTPLLLRAGMGSGSFLKID
ncbi:forkhead box protein P1-like [Osmia bicornis bicornis]|uniref:forkhead box protein P1-like n=1 Tax=Osmia bicornis bicornis TaxID=1437191 RepID=UPI0010F5509C|nr:forkhead box protein P1-like [Osmia bicornis bicornis]XP_029044264.1 forkhead box protein P1-like [Osmia bicornis bicornis]XP_029044265.1 forkhead box protein P1-like [Osmia bicornis bicornis]